MRQIVFSILLSGLVLAGCDTDGPLSDPTASQVDEALLGHWYGIQDDTQLHFFVGHHDVEGNPSTLVEIFGLQFDLKKNRFDPISESEGANPMPRLYASVTTLANQKFLSVFYRGSDPADLSSKESYAKWISDPKKNCLTLRYESDGKTMTFSILDGDSFQQATKRGDLVMKDGNVTAASLVAYLQKSGGTEVFGGELVKLEKRD